MENSNLTTWKIPSHQLRNQQAGEKDPDSQGVVYSVFKNNLSSMAEFLYGLTCLIM